MLPHSEKRRVEPGLLERRNLPEPIPSRPYSGRVASSWIWSILARDSACERWWNFAWSGHDSECVGTPRRLNMCLAIPGKVLDTYDQRGLRMARVQFGGILREACLEYVPETQIGEYVLVHVGFAISRIDEAEGERTYQALRDLDQLTELESPVVEEIEPGGFRQ